jgi:hypothetical protein
MSNSTTGTVTGWFRLNKASPELKIYSVAAEVSIK